MVFSWPPKVLTATMMTTAMRPTMMPYSTAVAPFSSLEAVLEVEAEGLKGGDERKHYELLSE